MKLVMLPIQRDPAYSAQRERRFHAIVNARGASAAVAADLGSSVHDEIDNVLGFAANAKYLGPGLAEGRVGAVSTGIAPGGLPRSAEYSGEDDRSFRLKVTDYSG